jgi:hypothetical protein
MNLRLCLSGWCVRMLFGMRLIPIAIGISLLPVSAMASQEPTAGGSCRQRVAGTRSDSPVYVSMKELETRPEDYYGKTVTVDGELNKTFGDTVFTIEDSRFFRNMHILVISTVAIQEAVTPLEQSVARGKNVRVTGVVQPYNRGRLECAYGPLHVDSRNEHSLTKNPVLIVDRIKSENVEMPSIYLVKPSFPIRIPKQPELLVPEPATLEVTTPEPQPAPPGIHGDNEAAGGFAEDSR